MQPILDSNISVTFPVKYNCNISKSKLVFPLSNEGYLGKYKRQEISQIMY